MIRKQSHPALLPRQVKTHVPKVPKQPLALQQRPVSTMKSPSKEMPESEQAQALPTARGSSLGPQMPIEGPEGLSLSRRTFVPLPPICSDSTVHSEKTTSQHSNPASRLSPEHLSDEDAKSTESIFLTQVPGPTCPCPPVPGPPGSCTAPRRLGCCRQLDTRRQHLGRACRSLLGDPLIHGYW